MNSWCDISCLTSMAEPQLGGTVKQTANQARALRNQGYGVTVAPRRRQPDLPINERQGGLQMRRLGGRRGRPGELLTMLGWAGRLLRSRWRVAVVQDR